ncbi:phosphoglucosamine mutase [Cellvibrio japonicus]|uniref:Phosphoglucosamine mutase n=1 Tax=Cellvibrio japonicus (strain Ueda107) TaxID=498211 RepID=GLMM_CELJU|nr:phosphoglucosamine mutase [Cellvibrio japonicus]B3PLQ1.1 RecName: Full=Phosphoglucosamine mutase [Cellvibrio japonicus Ueda107]ACE83954.1 phosphoglucosamine mutase [Cellvibrio japonicus Ueda107]QEI13033.1 phosphoglucosamine mutase [Cellvibrio japonicus]QEI16607.1 phosphoglucosamine mutase [Cellvibrio japonicus]QEI20185.1 phosphoglucosamine mutase [Cellvibrio japonicus]
MTRKYFGTDGIRGLVGEGPITPDFMLKLGWAAGRVLMDRFDGSNMILIGKDTRISGYMFESALQAGLINAGVDVGLLGPMPTPGVAYLTRTFQAQAGIVISASHNSYVDNGIKFFGGNGTKLPDDLEDLIEKQLEQPMVTAEKLGKAKRIQDASGRYIEFCKGTMPWGFNLKGMHLVIDCAHGATYNIAPNVFSELGAHVTPIFVDPNGTNINRGCGSTKPEALQEKVVELGADLGIAFDGDGDRVVFVDHKGELVDGDELLYIIAAYQQEYAGGCDGVVGTLMSNFGFELGLKKLGIPFARAKVGDRYVIEMMRERGWRLGGENSGHIVCSNVTTTGDGIISALQVLLAITTLGQKLHKIKKGMAKLPQVMINVHMAKRADLANNETIQRAVKLTEEKLGGSGRVLLRPSGTEPVVRVMVEGEDKAQVKELAQELASVVEAALS